MTREGGSERSDCELVGRAIPFERFREQIAKLKRELWAEIVAGEPPGRPVGRRPRDPEQEALLLRLDRARLARRGFVPPSRDPTSRG